MARTRTISSIEAEIAKIEAELDKAQKKVDSISAKLLKLQKQSRVVQNTGGCGTEKPFVFIPESKVVTFAPFM